MTPPGEGKRAAAFDTAIPNDSREAESPTVSLQAVLCARGPLKWSLVTPVLRERALISLVSCCRCQEVAHVLVTKFQGSSCLPTPTLALQCAYRTDSKR